MNSSVIRLHQDWQIGTEIGSGGFGTVYEAFAPDGSIAVVKLIERDPGADRELLFEQIPNHVNIIPILDSGEWENYYVIVMPRADMSLRAYMAQNGNNLHHAEIISILIDVTQALAHLEANVVHRDLKPDNVLFYQGHWCLADFGIARYAQATTDPETRKFSFSYPYAAPEQWRYERATSATDVYALGIMAFELFEHRWPFQGPESSDFRAQHLQIQPPTPTNCPAPIASLILECLHKPA